MMIREIKIQSKINRMKFLVIFDENDCIFLNMVIFWMLLDVVIGFICLLSGDINLIGTACYHTTRRADRRCCFFPVGGARGEVTAAVGAETRPK